MRIAIFFVFLGVLEASEIHQSFEHVENDVTKEILGDRTFILDLIKRVEVLESRDRSHALEISALKQEVFSQKKEIAALHRKTDNQERLISKLFQRLLPRGGIPTAPSASKNRTDSAVEVSDREDVTKKVTDREDVTREGTDREDVTREVTDREDVTKHLGNRIRRYETAVFVAFTAGLTTTMQNMGAYQNIVFDHVETNIGSGYNSHHGVFTAPVDGIYLFYTSVLAGNNREIWCQLVVNGKNKADAYARGTDGRHDQGSQAIIVQLQKGDDVAVQNIAADDSIYGDQALYTTFSGFLLLQGSPQTGSLVG